MARGKGNRHRGKSDWKKKILTGRPAEIMEGSENAYITGTWNTETGVFENGWNRFSMSLAW